VPERVAAHLRAADPVMAEVIERVGPLEYGVDGDLWRAVVGSIVGQQLSVKAAATIRGRVSALGGSGGFPPPELLLGISEETLRGCGLSRAKTSYVRDAARRWVAGELDPAGLKNAPDEEVIDVLIQLRGVGRWTAEMVLIFCLDRPDVLAVDDLGIRAAVQKAYALEVRPDRAAVLRMGEVWRPYRSYASLYLWRSLHS
jgi:DNA-3-methyladenine glycosylase II